jgi:hypothetical protein
VPQFFGKPTTAHPSKKSFGRSILVAGGTIPNVRLRALLMIPSAAAVFGCGDGVGHPILDPEQQGAVVTGTGGSGSAPTSTGGVSAEAGGTTGMGGTAFVPGGSGGKGGGDFGPPRTDGGASRNGWEAREPTEEGLVPDGSHCESVAEWDPAADYNEQELVQYLNFAREAGLACGSNDPVQAGPLVVSPALRCAARLHSRDMSERGFFDHVNPDGVGPEERMRQAGATFRVASESITFDEWRGDQGGPGNQERWQSLSELLMDRGADCENAVDPSFDQVGVGLFDGLLTLDFTGP